MHAQSLHSICHAGLAGELQTAEQNGGHQVDGPGELWRQLGA